MQKEISLNKDTNLETLSKLLGNEMKCIIKSANNHNFHEIYMAR